MVSLLRTPPTEAVRAVWLIVCPGVTEGPLWALHLAADPLPQSQPTAPWERNLPVGQEIRMNCSHKRWRDRRPWLRGCEARFPLLWSSRQQPVWLSGRQGPPSFIHTRPHMWRSCLGLQGRPGALSQARGPQLCPGP